MESVKLSAKSKKERRELLEWFRNRYESLSLSDYRKFIKSVTTY